MLDNWLTRMDLGTKEKFITPQVESCSAMDLENESQQTEKIPIQAVGGKIDATERER